MLQLWSQFSNVRSHVTHLARNQRSLFTSLTTRTLSTPVAPNPGDESFHKIMPPGPLTQLTDEEEMMRETGFCFINNILYFYLIYRICSL